jgi:hypothetical protein
MTRLPVFLLIQFLSPCGRNDFTSSASLQAARGKASTASQPDALQMMQTRFVKNPG